MSTAAAGNSAVAAGNNTVAAGTNTVAAGTNAVSAANDLLGAGANLVGSTVNVGVTGVTGLFDTTPAFTKSDLFAGIAGLGAFYMGIFAGGQVGRTLSCSTQRFIKDGHIIPHVIAFMAIIFFTSLIADKSNTTGDFWKQILSSIAVYIAFLMSTKTSGPMVGVLLSVLAVVFLIRKYMAVEKDPVVNYNLDVLQMLLAAVGVGALVFGFLNYYGEKRIEYDDVSGNWDGVKFLFGTESCKNAETARLNNMTKTLDATDKISRAFGVKTPAVQALINSNKTGGYLF